MDKKLQEKFDILISNLKKINKIKNNKILAKDIYELFLEDDNEPFLEYLSEKGYKVEYKDEINDLYDYSNNSLRAYLREISYFNELKPEEEKYYFTIYKKNPTEELKKFLIERNLKLVISVAKCFPSSGVEILDLIQAGNIGLMIAIDKFDAKKGFKFSTYARPWIWKNIRETIANDSRTIRLPVHVHEKFCKLTAVKNELLRKNNEEPSMELLMKHTGYKEKEINELLSMQTILLSLDTVVKIKGDEKGETLKDTIPEKSHLSLEDKVIGNIYVEQFWNIAKEDLSDIEYYVLSSRYDKKFNNAMSNVALGKELNVTHQAVSLIDQRAKRKCRQNEKLKYYR